MTRDQVYNFAAGPSVLPESALKTAQAELLNFRGSGMSVMEISHRSALFQEVFDSAQAKLRRLMNVPDTHEILLLQGGATTQFAAIPMNLIEGGCADYAVTGNFSAKAAEEAEKYGSVHIACSTADTGHDRIPTQAELRFSPEAKYFYYCANNTVYGTEWQYTPSAPSALVSDMSSDILSREVDVSKFGLIYAGAQKNMSPAGLTVVIVDKALAGRELPCTPKILSYKTMIETGSLLNTPPCWCIYMLDLTLDWVEKQGGVKAMDELRHARADRIYDFLDGSRLFTARALPGSRSYMNITFRTPSAELDAEFVKEAASRGLVNLKGHKVTGGLRASLYNAMPVEGAQALLDFMKEFEAKHHG
ncbi:MAG: 3-phosphoserine/phosphohydroxythreonine transaminase [Oscillospiraceae bacterium]|nr:3-phosphoserine/phosphohydroxythreonine transaminase [Oscillospiraceae bacterium]